MNAKAVDADAARKLQNQYQNDGVSLSKDGLLIGCISRGGKTITPRGSDTIEVGDSVIVVAAHSGLRSLNDIFTTRR